jgi:hypothetical protein
MRVELLIATLLWFMPASAQDDKLAQPWLDLYKQCQAWDFKSTEAFAKGAVKWDHSEHAAQDNIAHFTSDTCPAYLGSANAASSVGAATSSMTLEKFSRELMRVYSEVTESKGEAEKQKAYLDQNIAKLTKFFADGGWLIKDHPCGARFLERRTYVGLELERLQRNVDAIRTSCPKSAEVLAAKGVSVSNTARGASAKGQSGGPEIPAGKASAPASDITGLKPKSQP